MIAVPQGYLEGYLAFRRRVSRALDFLFSFQGRIGRGRYALTYAILLGLRQVYVYVRDALSARDVMVDTPEGILFAIFGTLFVLCTVSAVVRRLHDFNARAEWLVLMVVLSALLRDGIFVYAFCLAIMPVMGTPGANRFGPAPYDAGRFLLDLRLRRLARVYGRGRIGTEEFNARRAALIAPFTRPAEFSS